MAFTKSHRQKIIDSYLHATGRNLFVPAEFIDWLSGQPEHEAYDWFYGQSDEEAARQHRIGLARQMASGLRITAEVSAAPSKGREVAIAVREFPAMISPVAGRKDGGGYQTFDPSERDSMSELRRQGATALSSWLARYRGAAEAGGIDVTSIEEIISALREDLAGAA